MLNMSWHLRRARSCRRKTQCDTTAEGEQLVGGNGKVKEGIGAVIAQKKIEGKVILTGIKCWLSFWGYFGVFSHILHNSHQHHQKCLLRLVEASKGDNNRKHFFLAMFDREKEKER